MSARPVFLQWPRRRCDNPMEMDCAVPPPIDRIPASGPVRIYHQRPKPGARMRMVSRCAFPVGVCIAVAAALVHVAGLA